MHQRSLHHSRISPCGRYVISSHFLLPFSLLYGECGNFFTATWLNFSDNFPKEAALKSATNLWLYSRMTPASFFVSLCSSDKFQTKYHTRNGILNIKESEILIKISSALKINFVTNFFLLLLFWLAFCMLINAKIMFS